MGIGIAVVVILVAAAAVWYERRNIAAVAEASEVKVATWFHARIITTEDRLKDYIKALETRVKALEDGAKPPTIH
jgi:hypothetical protein